MAWFYLFLAGLFEIGWPVGLKIAQQPGSRLLGVSLAILFLAASGVLLWLAQRDIPLGTSYAVWTGIGSVGTFLVGIFVYDDPALIGRILGVTLIVAGIILLKLSHP